MKNMKMLLAEMLGTFTLVLVGCGSAVIAGQQIGLLGVALCFGLAVTMMAYTVGGISGGHFNPAVTIGQMVAGKVSWSHLPTYLIGQIVGGALGALVIYLIMTQKAGFEITGNFASTGFGASSPMGFNATAGAIAEVVATFIFVSVILGTSQKNYPPAMGGLIIGLTLAAMIMLIGLITNASLNPARSLATAIFEGGTALSQVWFFFVWPIVGAVLAAIFHKMLFHCSDDGSCAV